MVNKTDINTDRLVLSVEEAAAALGIGKSTAFKYIREGKLPVKRLGRRILVPRDKLTKFLNQTEGSGYDGPK
ncbi:MAG: helix-turn-helix domain-containing protein [Dehalococcoidia bacterium]